MTATCTNISNVSSTTRTSKNKTDTTKASGLQRLMYSQLDKQHYINSSITCGTNMQYHTWSVTYCVSTRIEIIPSLSGSRLQRIQSSMISDTTLMSTP